MNIDSPDLISLLANLKTEFVYWAFAIGQASALLTVPSVLLRRRGRPTASLAWLLTLFLLPVLGLVLWWAFGRMRLARKPRGFAQNAYFIRQRMSIPGVAEVNALQHYLPERALGKNVFPTLNNQVELLKDGQQAFTAIRASLEEAQESIFLLFYIFQLDQTGNEILALLERKAAAGVKVRLLVDGFGSGKSGPRIRRRLQKSKVDFAIFLESRMSPLSAPRLNFINHRKIMVIDHRVAFTGGMNIAQEYEHTWRDLMLKLEGPAVQALLQIFLEDWCFTTNEVIAERPLEITVPRTPIASAVISSGPDSESWIHDCYFLAITQAHQSLHLVTPYFIPSPALLTAMRTAAGRGVEVTLVLPSQSDVGLVKWASRSFYRMLVEAGVKIYEYPKEMIHAKAFVADGRLASVGTANIDNRSMKLSFEVSCFVLDDAIARDLSEWIAELRAEAEEITMEKIAQKSHFTQLGESLASLFSPLL